MTEQQTVSAQGPEAGRALQKADPAAVAPKEEPAGGHLVIRGIANSPDKTLERVDATIMLPTSYQYSIPFSYKDETTGQWLKSNKVGITSDGYDYLNRAIGCSFFFPPTVHDEHGNERPNPIHRPDYIYMRMGGVWRSPIGQLLATYEDIEVDFRLMYQNKRANARSATIVMGENGPLWDDAGNIVLKLSPEDELKAYKELAQNRSFGPRYAITVGRIRILKMATGLRSLPYDGALRPYPVKVTGFRDMMSPQERIASATGTLDTLYGGRPADIKPLTADEADEAGLTDEMDAEEQHEREQVAQALANQTEERIRDDKANAVAGDPSQLPWSADDLADLK